MAKARAYSFQFSPTPYKKSNRLDFNLLNEPCNYHVTNKFPTIGNNTNVPLQDSPLPMSTNACPTHAECCVCRRTTLRTHSHTNALGTLCNDYKIVVFIVYFVLTEQSATLCCCLICCHHSSKQVGASSKPGLLSN